MKQGMIDIKLVDVCGIQYGCPFDASLFSTSPSEGMPLIRIRDVKGGQTETYYSGEYSPEFIIRKGDYLIGMDGEFNIAPWQSEDALLNQRVCKIYTKSHDVVIRYVYRFLQKELKKIEDETPFVTVKHLSAKRLNQVYLPVPPIAEQEKIVAELDCLSGIIEKKKQQLKELDNLAQSIFYEMFGDPVENDKGWDVKKFGDVANSELGKMLDSKKNQGELYPYLCSANVQWNDVDCTQVKEMRFEEDELERYRVYKGDLLICEGGDTGRCAIWKSDNAIYYQNALHRVRFVDGLMLPIFCLYTMKCYKERGEIDKYSSGQTIKHLVKKVLLTIPLIVPPITLQQEFASKIESIEKQKELIAQSIKETETLFNSRMDYYFK